MVPHVESKDFTLKKNNNKGAPLKPARKLYPLLESPCLSVKSPQPQSLIGRKSVVRTAQEKHLCLDFI